MSDTKVGVLIDESAQRDAIHIAVAPVVSDGHYEPGKHVGLMPDGRVGGDADKAIGIIDPFLKRAVETNQRCWLFLYPQTIKGLRHHWSHPAFSDEAISDKAFSEKWLRGYAAKMNCYDNGEEAYQRLIEGLKEGEIFSNGSDLHTFADLDEADELKMHAERVLGINIDWSTYKFVCTC